MNNSEILKKAKELVELLEKQEKAGGFVWKFESEVI